MEIGTSIDSILWSINTLLLEKGRLKVSLVGSVISSEKEFSHARHSILTASSWSWLSCTNGSELRAEAKKIATNSFSWVLNISQTILKQWL